MKHLFVFYLIFFFFNPIHVFKIVLLIGLWLMCVFPFYNFKIINSFNHFKWKKKKNFFIIFAYSNFQSVYIVFCNTHWATLAYHFIIIIYIYTRYTYCMESFATCSCIVFCLIRIYCEFWLISFLGQTINSVNWMFFASINIIVIECL